MIYLDALRREDMPLIVKWRNKNPEGARTPYLLTEEMQDRWYAEVVCNRDSLHRYWAVRLADPPEHVRSYPEAGYCAMEKGQSLVGISGLTHIEWENSRAEIALMIDPEQRGKGYGKAALRETLQWGFDNMGLHRIYGECYKCNGSLEFWLKAAAEYSADTHAEQDTKWWEGRWWDSFCFSIAETAI